MIKSLQELSTEETINLINALSKAVDSTKMIYGMSHAEDANEAAYKKLSKVIAAIPDA
jgi:hypothetical protein